MISIAQSRLTEPLNGGRSPCLRLRVAGGIGLALLASIVLNGCGRSTGAMRGDGGGRQDPPLVPEGSTENHLDVVPVLDSIAKVEGTFDPYRDLTLSVTDSRGVRYDLLVPAFAYPGPLSIQMTPVQSIDGYPFQALHAAAVHLGPEGTQFLLPVRLTITLPVAPAADSIAFASVSGGRSFHMRPESVLGSVLVMETSHFTIFGTGPAATPEVDAQALRTPQDWMAHLQQQTAHKLREIRECEGACPTATDVLSPLLSDWYAKVVTPRNKQTFSGCKFAEQNFALLTNWGKMVQLLALETDFAPQFAEFEGLVSRQTAECADEMSERCGDPFLHYGALAHLLGLESQAVLLNDGATAMAIECQAAQCAIGEGDCDDPSFVAQTATLCTTSCSPVDVIRNGIWTAAGYTGRGSSLPVPDPGQGCTGSEPSTGTPMWHMFETSIMVRNEPDDGLLLSLAPEFHCDAPALNCHSDAWVRLRKTGVTTWETGAVFLDVYRRGSRVSKTNVEIDSNGSLLYKPPWFTSIVVRLSEDANKLVATFTERARATLRSSCDDGFVGCVESFQEWVDTFEFVWDGDREYDIPPIENPSCVGGVMWDSTSTTCSFHHHWRCVD